MSTSSNLAPSSSPFQISAFILTRSTMPLKFSSEPMGIWMGSGLAPRLVTIMLTQL